MKCILIELIHKFKWSKKKNDKSNDMPKPHPKVCAFYTSLIYWNVQEVKKKKKSKKKAEFSHASN